MDFFKFRENLKKLTESKIISLAIESIKEKDVTFLNQEQLKIGYDSNNKEMPRYSKKTLEIKRKKGGYISPSGKIALRDKGDLWDKMKVFKEVDFMSVFSTDKKYNLLIDRYGKDVFGLNKKDTEAVLENSQSELHKKINKILNE